MSEGARLATRHDLPVVEWLVAGVREDMAPHRGGEIFLINEVGRDTPAGDLDGALTDDDAVAVVGVFDEVVFGAAFAKVRTLEDGRRIGYLHTFLVQPEAREVGIGEAMMNLVIEELKARGCVGVDSAALPGDRESKNFFESFGLKARLLTVHRSFDAGA
ncbi:MAG: GNAT family N-acetyltransferase [Actinomycetota bacterium]